MRSRSILVAALAVAVALAGCAQSEDAGQDQPLDGDAAAVRTADTENIGTEVDVTRLTQSDCVRFAADFPQPKSIMSGYTPPGFSLADWPDDPTGSLGVLRMVATRCTGPGNETVGEHYEAYLVEPTDEWRRDGASSHAVLAWAVIGDTEHAVAYESWGFGVHAGDVTVDLAETARLQQAQIFADSGSSSTDLSIDGYATVVGMAPQTERWFGIDWMSGSTEITGVFDVDWTESPTGGTGTSHYTIQTAGVVVLAGAGIYFAGTGDDLTVTRSYVPIS